MDCGYPLATDQRRCPECGSGVHEAALKTRWFTPRKVALWLILCYAAAFVGAAALFVVFDAFGVRMSPDLSTMIFTLVVAACSLLLGAAFIAITWRMPQWVVQWFTALIVVIVSFPLNWIAMLGLVMYLHKP